MVWKWFYTIEWLSMSTRKLIASSDVPVIMYQQEELFDPIQVCHEASMPVIWPSTSTNYLSINKQVVWKWFDPIECSSKKQASCQWWASDVPGGEWFYRIECMSTTTVNKQAQVPYQWFDPPYECLSTSKQHASDGDVPVPVI
jgi:hypothetical protein